MKRVSLTLDEVILSILKEKVRCLRVQKLADFVGKIEWTGDLSQMRGGSPRRRPRVQRRKKRAAN